ncbi:PAS domain-containing protein [Sunxiuqinia dokdonensis]|uniref:histidine kinase n=1 Tax=Sunxiuqinia dokdonensis TaxID=1409788 RepID=A0A0L8V707_9BACT|nr:PAS domain-containing sensor histidine kinase [Sunxiuqinia dokdonensis]KOH43997.1 histidine kinase [Sunxiuqinia dokdonensis]
MKKEDDVHLEKEKPNELFQKLFDFHTTVQLMIDPSTGRIVDANRAATDFYGCPKEQLTQMNAQELAPGSPEKNKNWIEQASKKELKYVELQQQLVNKSIRDVEVYMSPLELNGSELLHAIVHDISNRKQAEKIVALNEARLRQAEMASKSGNWELHLDSQEIFASDGALRIYEVHQDHLDYSSVRQFPLPEYRAMLDQAMNNLLRYGNKYEVEFRIQAADSGKIKHIHSIATFDPDKRIVFGIIQDITERKQNEESLKKSEEKYRNLIEMAPDAFFQGDEKGNFITVNDKATELTGYTREELLQMNMANLFFSEKLSQKPLRYDLLRSGETIKNERDIKRKNGEKIQVEMNSKAMPDGTYQSFIRDISERKQAEQILLENEIRLRQLNATKDKFFSIIAHDLKSPFNSIIGFTNLLAEQIEEKDYEGIDKYVNIIEHSAQNAMDLLLNLLEWSRTQSGRTEFNPEFVDSVGLINEAVDLLNDAAQQKSINIIKEIPHDAPVFADRYMISSVLRNLISNAIKFTHPGGQILISAREENQELQIAVTDNGVGISNESQNKLFRIEESYSTLGTLNEKGTGLGLILCKEFVEKHKGKIRVESEEGKGSQFLFTIPAGGNHKL